MGAALEFGILGPLQVRVDGGAPAALGGPRQRALLAALIVAPNEVVSTDLLVDQLWGEHPPPTATHTVRVFVSRLRRALASGSARLETKPPGYLIRVEPDEVDASRCEALYSQGRSALTAGDPETGARVLGEALALWRGAPLADFTYEPFAQPTIARLEELRVACREELVEAGLARGHHVEVIADLEALVRDQPFRERPHGQLMLALYRCGRQADALDAFQRARRTLVEALAVEPSASLRDLEQAILRQDPVLLGPDAAIVPVVVPGPDPSPAPAAVPQLDQVEIADPVREVAVTVRKTATVLVVSLAPIDRSDPEVARNLFNSARAEVERVVRYHGGAFVPSAGGETVAIFGLPVTKEDDALRAVRAAFELRSIASSLPPGDADRVEIRMGVDTGEVVAAAHDDVFGEPLSAAAQLSRNASVGQVLLTDATRRLVPEHVRVEAALDDDAWSLVDLVADPGMARLASSGPLVARGDEIAAARAVFTRAARDRTAQMLVVTGDAGIGKSRLAFELTEQLSKDATVLNGHCLSYGEGIAFWPLREALSLAAGDDSPEAIRELLDGGADSDVVADIVIEALGLGEGDIAGDQVPWAFRALFESIAADRPLLLIIDDAHSASLELLKLVTYLVDWLSAPVMVLCLARPDLFDPRLDWGGDDPRVEWNEHARVEVMKLAPLSSDQAGLLLELRLSGRELTASERTRVVDAAGGNPLFMEQLVAISAENPWWDRGRDIPATLQTLLAARLDRLGPAERAIVERAAVIGRAFWPSPVRELLPAEARASVNSHIRGLIRRGLIEPERSILTGEEQLRFHHILIRDVAYASTPKAVRGALHERFADWLSRRDEGFEEFIGFHLDSAYTCRAELDSHDEALPGLALRAADALAAAGRRARARGDTNASVKLLRRGSELIQTSDGSRPDVLVEFGSALSESGDFPGAEPVLLTALEQSRAAKDELAEARAMIELSYWRSRAHETEAVTELRGVAERVIPVFARAHDEAGLARAWQHIAWAHWIELRCAEMESALEKALTHSDRSGEARGRSQILIDLARAAVIGPRPVDDAIPRCQDVLNRGAGDVGLVAFTDTMLAVLEAMAGRVEPARARWLDGKRRLADYGLTLTVAVVQMFYAFIELVAGTPGRAEGELTAACSFFDRIGDQGRLSSASALLARVLCEEGRYDESGRYSLISRDSASADDALAQVYWRGAQSRVMAHGSQDEDAVRLANHAVLIAERTDFLLLQGDALSDRAEVHATLNEPERAAEDLAAAIACYERKGIVECARRAREARQALMSGSPLGPV